MTEQLGTLRTDMTVDVEAARKSLRDAAADLRRKAQEMKGEWNGLGDSADKALGSFTAMRAGIGALVGGVGFGAMIKSAVDAGGALADLQERTGMSTDAIQAWQFAGRQAGMQLGDVNANLQMFARRVGDARKGEGEMVAAMKDGNRALLDRIRNARTQDEALEISIDALEKTTDATARASLANDIFGKTGLQLSNVSSAAAAKAKELGHVLSEDMVKAADEAGDKMQALGMQIDGVKNKLVLEYAPALIKIFDTINNLMAQGTPEAMRKNFVAQAQAIQEGIAKLEKERAKLLDRSDIPESLKGIRLEAIDKQISVQREAVKGLNQYIEVIDNQTSAERENADATRDRTSAGRAKVEAIKVETAAELKLAEAMLKADPLWQELMETKRLADERAKESTEIVKANRTELEKQVDTISRLNELYDSGDLTLDEYNKALERLSRTQKDLQEETKKSEDVSRQMGLVMTSTFEDTIATMVTAKKAVIDFDVIWRAMAADMIKIALRQQVSTPFLNWMFGGAGNTTTPFGGVGAQPYAAGGDFPALQPMLVGERGPELIVPRGAGTVVPNHALGGGAQIGPFVNVSRADIPALRAMAADIVAQSQNAAFERHRRTGR